MMRGPQEHSGPLAAFLLTISPHRCHLFHPPSLMGTHRPPGAPANTPDPHICYSHFVCMVYLASLLLPYPLGSTKHLDKFSFFSSISSLTAMAATTLQPSLPLLCIQVTPTHGASCHTTCGMPLHQLHCQCIDSPTPSCPTAATSMPWSMMTMAMATAMKMMQ